jgi:YD repeat-containing protein
VTDPNGNTTSYLYDDFHRLAHQVSPVTGTMTYQYDPAGNLVATTDARGTATARTYDASNRVLTSTSQLAGAATETVTYSYDSSAAGSFGKGRLARMTDPSGATAYTYERRGLLKSEGRTILGSAYGTAYQPLAHAEGAGGIRHRRVPVFGQRDRGPGGQSKPPAGPEATIAPDPALRARPQV